MTTRKTAVNSAPQTTVLHPPAATRTPVDRTAARRQARLRARLGAPVKAFLEPDLRRRLDQHAATRQMTIADVLRDALRAYLDQQQSLAVQAEPVRSRLKRP